MYLAGEQERLFAAAKRAAAVPLDADSAAPRKRPTAGAKQDVLWSRPGDLQVRAMVLAGEGEDKRLYVAGAKGDWVTSQDAYEGRLGNVLRAVSVDDGEIVAEHDLPAMPTFDGMSAAGGRLYIALTDGRVVGFGADAATTRGATSNTPVQPAADDEEES
jgi:hypothetical protein